MRVMIFVFMNRRIEMGPNQLVVALGLGVAALTLGMLGFGPISVIILLGFIYLALRFATKPLSRFIARLGLNPNPPKDTDGRREGSGRGWVRELQGRWPGVLG